MSKKINPNLESIGLDEYLRDFDDLEKLKIAYEKAWDCRKFEIELYWKRATYFWTFTGAVLTGYFLLVNSPRYRLSDKYDHVEVYFVVCVGFFLSLAWLLSTRGSKAWQRNWETQTDLLEDKIVGPLHKTVTFHQTFSVSKINELVSCMFIFIWVMLGVKYFFDQGFVLWGGVDVNWFFVVATVGLVVMCYVLFYKGVGRFKVHDVEIYRRKFKVDGKVLSKIPLPPAEVDFMKKDMNDDGDCHCG